MNSEEMLREMIRIDRKAKDDPFGFDCEKWHKEADALLIKILRDLGYDDVCDWFEHQDKWYA